MSMVKRNLIPFFIVFLWFSGAWAKKAPLTIKSDRMEVMEKQNIVVFSGHVVAQKKDLTIYADRLIVYYAKKDKHRKVQKIVAVGHVKIKKGDWIANAGKAVYFKDQERIVLEDNPQVWQGENTIRGDRIIYFINENRSVAESGPGHKAEVVIFAE